MKRSISILFAISILAPASAAARNTEQILPAATAIESERGQAHLLDVPFYFKGQPHPAVVETVEHADTNQMTRNGAFRSDEQSCNVAVLSALRELQQSVQLAGGDAVIDIVSVTRGTRSESSTDFRCVAGTMIVHVGLRGTIVKLGSPSVPAVSAPPAPQP